MEDLDDNLPTHGKRYYMSNSDYIHNETNPLFIASKGETITISLLVCASNKENARKAVISSIEKHDCAVIRCRIENLVVGE